MARGNWGHGASEYRHKHAWTFRWGCSVCGKERDFLVDEHQGQTQVWGRCRVCTKLLPIRPEHRERATATRRVYDD